MNTNKQLLLDIATRLTDSTKTSWDRGDLEQWANHGKSMKTTILSVVPILKTLSEEFKPIDNNRTFNNVQALLKTADEVKQGYANINTLKSLESPNYSYSTDIQPNTANNNYKYLLISN